MATPAQLLPHVDELVMEYLLFRGFTKSFQALAAERKRDRTKHFDVEQIISQLLTFVQTYQIESILDTWKFLEARFFSRLDASYVPTIRQLEESWLRLYVVNAIKTGQRDKVMDFFKLLADKLNASGASTSSSDSWHRWFILPYARNPESDPYFRSFFAKQWLESFVTSFRNFLSLIFRNLPLPKLLAFQISRLEEPSIKLRLKSTQSECSRLRSATTQSAERIRKLEDAGHQLYGIVQTLVQHTFAEHFVSAEGGSSSSKSPATMKMMETLSEQLKDLSQVFGPTTDQRTSQIETELEAALLNPLRVTLNPAKSLPPDDDGVSSSHKAMSSQLSSSAGSALYEPALVETIALNDDGTTHVEGICAFADDGSRLSVSGIGQRQISIFDVNPDGSSTLSDRIRTESGVVAVDWVAKSESILFALQDGTINVWDTEAKVRTFIISHSSDDRRPTHVACARSKAIGAIALAGIPRPSSDDVLPVRIQFFTVEDNAMQVLSSVELTQGFAIARLRWSDDASVLAVSSSDGRITFLRESNPHVLGTWQSPGRSPDAIGLELTPHAQSMLVGLQPSSGGGVHEWSLHEAIAGSDAAPNTSYSLPKELTSGETGGVIGVKGLGESFVVVSKPDPSKGLGSAFVLLMRGKIDPTSTVVHVSSRIDSMAWHPEGHFITAVTRTGELMTWKVGA